MSLRQIIITFLMRLSHPQAGILLFMWFSLWQTGIPLDYTSLTPTDQNIDQSYYSYNNKPKYHSIMRLPQRALIKIPADR